MTEPVNPRLVNLLAAFTLGLADDGAAALAAGTGLIGSAPTALLALGEFLDGTTIRRLAEVLGLTHSGAVRLVTILEEAGLAERTSGSDRRTVEVRLTAAGRRREKRARRARAALLRETVADLDAEDRARLENLLEAMTRTRVRARMERRARGETGVWWCRTCDFDACGRPADRCPALTTARSVPQPPE